ncbi:hypothetical protein [Parasitella parasitica]|uniref:Uncharacterized protein n=1 Tax=Parasitella parasitica TaxID=35722 RepID=A0A0B7N5N9_9FUNG|nr:hypothetical protein [Parasitella parasitica]
MDIAQMELDLELDAQLEAELMADLEAEDNNNTTTTSSIPLEYEAKPDVNKLLVSDEATDRFEALPRPTAIFLHGVDDMSTADITKYTDSPLLVKIEWINDSSCNLTFKTEQDALQVAQTLMSQPAAAEIDHRALVPAKPFENHSNLSMRIATDEDVKERGARERSRYYLLHGVDDQPLSEDRKEARKAHVERMRKNGGDGRDVFSRLGARLPERRDRNRDRSQSPTKNVNRRIKRERSVEREIPRHLKDRLGLVKTEVVEDDQQDDEKESCSSSNSSRSSRRVKDEML